jgi:ankyrin repeat protein
VEQLRKLARDLLRAYRAGQPGAAARLTAIHLHPKAQYRLSDAQMVIAREHGFTSWPRLKAYVDRVNDHGADLRHLIEADVGYYEDRASGLLSAHDADVDQAVEVFRRHHPQMPGSPTIADARLVLARQHGFDGWPSFRRHVESMRDGGRDPFMRAVAAIQKGDGDELGKLVTRYSGLVIARGTNGNDLLALAAGMGNVAIVEALLHLGADVAGVNDRGWSALHQAAYMNHVELVRVLLGAGAPTDRSGHGDGGTPLVVALFWGHSAAAELVAEHDLAPANLRVAAGLGRLDLLRRLIRADGRLAPAAGAHRAFYRPHTGFPLWQPSGQRQEIIDEALVWACKSGRVNVLGALAAVGANLDADPYRGTPLAWATVNGHLDTAGWLLDHGADVNHRSTFGGPAHGEGVTALHLAAQCGQVPMTRLLLTRGADPRVEDAVYHGTPLDWARNFARHGVAAVLQEVGS